MNTMLRLGTPPPAPPERRGAKDINVVCDQIGLPTYTLDLSAYMHHVISHIGTYHGRTVHANNSGEHVSRHGFACEIFEIARTMSMNVHKDLHVMSCASDEYPTAAKRPSYSVMLSDDESYMMPDWKDALGRYVERLGSTS